MPFERNALPSRLIKLEISGDFVQQVAFVFELAPTAELLSLQASYGQQVCSPSVSSYGITQKTGKSWSQFVQCSTADTSLTYQFSPSWCLG